MTFSRLMVGKRDMSWAISQLYAKKSQKPSDKSFLWINVPISCHNSTTFESCER